MIPSNRYPEMEHVFDIYFGQDFDLFGETVPEIIACYKKDSPHHYKDLIRELASFRSEHPDDLHIAYEHFRRGFRPEGDGYTVTSFFDEIQRLLKD